MNAGMVWWGQIGNSLQLLTAVMEHLRDCRSVVLQLRGAMPWRRDFYEAVDLRRAAFGAVRRLVRLPWEPGMEPGSFVLQELCSARVQADYWPGRTYGDYLGSRDDLMLNDYYVWVTGISNKADLYRWSEFVAQYDRAAGGGAKRAVFILEYSGSDIETAGIDHIVYAVEDYDCRVFCLEMAAILKNTDLREYQAELALRIGGVDPETCWVLLQIGTDLLDDPVRAVRVVVPSLTEQQIVSAAWRSAVVVFFPMLEQWRMDFISRHRAELERHLRIRKSKVEQVCDPWDLEISALHLIVCGTGRVFTPEETENVRLCRRARNLLAHNKVISCDDARRIVQL